MKFIATIMIALVCMAAAQEKPKVAVYATGGKSQSENKALSNKMTNALVSSGKYRTIERSDAFLAQVIAEQEKQRDGSIDDRQISQLGKQAGANYVCIAEMVEAFGGHQISARILNVESAEVTLSGEAHGVLNSMQAFDDITNNVIASMFGLQKKVLNTQAATVPMVTAQVARPAASTASGINGTLVPGATLTDKLSWLRANADSHNTYILEANANESITQQKLEYSDIINLTVVLRGAGANRVIRLKSHGAMFRIHQNVTFILDNNITLQGHSGNTASIIDVLDKGTLKMNNGATITGNDNHGGVWIGGGGTFEMNGGTISNNVRNGDGGGVLIDGGIFTMNGGVISGNTANNGGGVYVWRGNFTMDGGTISGNIASNAAKTGGCGGGVSLWNRSGCCEGVTSNTFNMRGGTIASNIALSAGGGVCIYYAGWGSSSGNGTFTKTGGTITGYTSDANSGNIVRTADNILTGNGHAVWFKAEPHNKLQHKEVSVVPRVNLSCNKDGCSGVWDE